LSNAFSSVLLIIPAFNEEGAIGRVVREVRELHPGLDVLVIDDHSNDGTIGAARAAGARVLALPCHLGLGGCVQAGYKLAFELGYENVIRIDGDGQHDPRDIPRLLEALRTSGVEMAIGAVKKRRRAPREPDPRDRDPFLQAAVETDPGASGHRSDVGVCRRKPARARGVQPQLSARVSRDRGSGCPAAAGFPVRGSALPDAEPHGGAEHDHTAEVGLLRRARSAGRIRQHPPVRRFPAPEAILRRR
jgi:glycosyltransferase involved in cell wall biosynthesis